MLTPYWRTEFECREHGGRREYDDQRLHRALEDAHLRRVLAREQVVLGVHPETAEIKVGGELYRVSAIHATSTTKAISSTCAIPRAM